MDKEGVGLLLAAVIKRAVDDRRLAVTHGLIDRDCMSLPGKWRDKMEIITGLREFFIFGGLEVVAHAAEFDLPIDKIKAISGEPYR